MEGDHRYERLKTFFAERRGDRSRSPDASIVIPVNAQGDHETVSGILGDIARYEGGHTFEVVLALNNYPEGEEPAAVDLFRSMEIVVEPTPDVRRPEEAVCFSARMTGIRAANTDRLLLFDSDCRIPDPTALIDWYIDRLDRGAALAYTPVGYFELNKKLSVRVRVAVHHAARWVKRALLRIPTTRGGNYAVSRARMLWFYDQGYLSDDLNVGPTFKAAGLPVVYSGRRKLVVRTSGRVFRGGWLKLARYLVYRLRYNMKLLPVGRDVTSRIERGRDNVRTVQAP